MFYLFRGKGIRLGSISQLRLLVRVRKKGILFNTLFTFRFAKDKRLPLGIKKKVIHPASGQFERAENGYNHEWVYHRAPSLNYHFNDYAR